MPSRGYREQGAKLVLAEKGDGMFVVAVQLYDLASGKDVDTLPNNLRFFARIIERGGQIYVDRGDFDALLPFDSKDEARQYLQILFELEND